MVWLNTRNLVTKRPCQKLENCRASPYKVKKVVNTHAIELKLPEDICIHPVFHVNLLEPATIDLPHLGHIQLLPPPIKVDSETKWEVEAIVDSRYFGRSKKLQYRVRWTGYPELNWEDATNITNSPDLLHNFHTRYPGKPGPGPHLAVAGTRGLAGARRG